MGLDITAYKNLKKVENPILDEDGYPENWESNWLPGASMKWSESVWPGRGEGVDPDTTYSFEEEYDFRAGSYSGYNWWRDNLRTISNGAAFRELIDFADNEGVIGTVVSRKLAEDFESWEGRAASYANNLGEEGKYWIDRYRCWKKAFQMASENGAVDFH